MKKKILSLVITALMIMTFIPCITAPVDAASVSYGWPSSCRTITGHWGKESGHYYPYHYGIDIGAAGGSKVYAAAAGKVIGAGLYGGYGYCVRIKHSNGQVTLYGHNKSLAVKKGQSVKKGQTIAYVGGTGAGGQKVYANHIHFGIYKNVSALSKEDGRSASSITINPETVLKKGYSITYSASGASNVPATAYKTKNKTYYVSKTKPIKTGYTFSYWKGSNGKKYYPGSKYKTNKKLKLTAVWTTNTYTFSYNQSGYSSVKVKYGGTFTVSAKKPEKSGYTFKGWIAKRSDGKYYVSGTGWVTSSSSARLYNPGQKYKIDSSWVKGTYGNKSFTMIAKYEVKSSQGLPEGNIVTESEYNSKYKGNSQYKCTRVYRYATRSKQTTTSGYDTLSGYTKYDSQTTTSYSGYKFGTPISTSTSYSGGKKVTTSASNSGYYYYAYAAANPTNTSDWSFVCSKTRSELISYMKQNYSSSSAWSENNLRYFWYISSTDLGSTAKGSQISKSIPYCDNSNVSVGTLSSNGTHYYDIPMYKYNRCYKVKTVTTVNYFYKWSAWSAWSDWVTYKPTESDTLKVDSAVYYHVAPITRL